MSDETKCPDCGSGTEIYEAGKPDVRYVAKVLVELAKHCDGVRLHTNMPRLWTATFNDIASRLRARGGA